MSILHKHELHRPTGPWSTAPGILWGALITQHKPIQILNHILQRIEFLLDVFAFPDRQPCISRHRIFTLTLITLSIFVIEYRLESYAAQWTYTRSHIGRSRDKWRKLIAFNDLEYEKYYHASITIAYTARRLGAMRPNGHARRGRVAWAYSGFRAPQV